jgi:hypothetical protein
MRAVSRAGTVALAGRVILAAEILAGRRVGIRIEGAALMFFDLETRELLRTRPNPIPPGQAKHLRGVRPVGPPPRPSVEPITVQRGASNTGVITVCSQRVALGRVHRHQTVTIHVSETTWPLNSTMAKPGSCAAPPPCRSVTSMPTGHGRSPQFPR